MLLNSRCLAVLGYLISTYEVGPTILQLLHLQVGVLQVRVAEGKPVAVHATLSNVRLDVTTPQRRCSGPGEAYRHRVSAIANNEFRYRGKGPPECCVFREPGDLLECEPSFRNTTTFLLRIHSRNPTLAYTPQLQM